MATPVKAEFVLSSWEGFPTIKIRAKIVEGPTNFLDRHVLMALPFSTIRHMMTMVEKKLAEDKKRIDAINKENSGKG